MHGFSLNTFFRFSLTALTALILSACNNMWPSDTATRGAAVASGDLSDGEILQVVANLNSSENRQAQMAMERAESEEVRDVAETILEDHKSANNQLDELARSGMTLEKSPLSRGLSMQANAIREDLADLSGTEFECTYLNKQIDLHELALTTVREDLQPSAEDERVQELLSNIEPHLQEHLEEVRQVQQNLEECTA